MLHVDVRLAKNTAQRAYWYFVLSRHDGSIHRKFGAADELDMTSLLGGFGEPRSLETALHLSVGEWAKPRQPQPRWFSPMGDDWTAAARSGVPVLP